MIIAYVKHNLTPEGKQYFQEKWFPMVEGFISVQKGFLLIEYHPDQKQEDCLHITVKFDNQENLDTWVATPEHASVLNLLDPYRTRPWYYVITENTNIDKELLMWNEVA